MQLYGLKDAEKNDVKMMRFPINSCNFSSFKVAASKTWTRTLDPDLEKRKS